MTPRPNSFPFPVAGPVAVRAAQRGLAGVLLFFLIDAHAGHVLIILAIMSAIGPLEMAECKTVWRFCVATWRAITRPARDPECPDCLGTGQIAVSFEADDDNCCPTCMGAGSASVGHGGP